MQRGKKSLIIRLMVAFCLVFAMGAFVVLAGGAGSCGGSTAATYSVTYNYDQTESTVTGSDEATEGESFSFTAQAKTDYKLTSVTATVGGEDVELDQSGNTYTIAGESVTGDIVVTVDAEALPVTTYTVEYADVTGATVEGAESVEEGASLTFTVTAETGYEISSVTATVGGESVTPASNGNEYTIANVTGNVVVTVVASKISYAVTVNAQNAEVKVAESISYGEDLTFTVDAKDESYEVTSVTATVGGENANVTNEGKEYTVSNVTGDVVITVNAAQKTYNVEIDATNATVNGVTDGQKVNHGADISFTVSATDGYEIVVDAKMAGKDIEVVMDGDTYSIPNVTGDVIIIVTTKLIEYTVDVNATNATVNGITDGQTVVHNGSLTFTVNAIPGYENVKVSATVGGEDVTPSNEGNSYTISNITGNVVITVTASQIVYDVTVNAENATVTVDESIAYGETLEFTVKAEEGYTVTKVTVNDEGVTAGSDGTYTVENITSDVTIVVATEISTYTVSVAENDHAQVNFVGETTVQHGGQVQFTVTVDNGYVLNRVYLNNNVSNVLTPDDEGVYTISNITSDTVIHIGLNRETYSVSFNEGAFEVSGDPTVAFEGNYTFGVVANEGYNIASVTAVMGGEPVSVTDNEDGSYTIVNVTGNIEVTITCQVITFGVEYNYDEEQVTVEGADSVDYNGELTFTVTAKPGYNITSVSATVGGSTLTVSNNGNEYTISISGATVTGDIVITVASEQDASQGYDVTFTAPDGYSVVCEDVHTGVEAGTVIEFTVNVPEGYSDEIEVYAAADTKLEPTNGKYTLEVIEDTEVVVKVYINISDTTKEETHYSISGTGRFEYPVAQPYTFTVTADEYYNIASVTVNGQVLEGVEGVYTIPSEMLINDVNIVVDANPNEYTINYYDYEYADLSKNSYVELEEPLRVNAADSAVYTIDNIGSFSLADISETYYDFLGWSEGALGDEYTALTSEDVLAALASGNGSIDLYANWQWGGENAVESVKDALDASINVTQSAESSIRAGFDFGSNEWRFLKQELWKHGDHTEIFGYMYFTTNPNTDGVADSVSIDSIINSDDVTIYEVGTGNTSPVYRDSNLRLYAWSTGRSRIDNIVSEYGFVWSGATAEICQSRWVKGWIAINIDGDRIVIQQDNFVWFADVRTA